MAHGCTSLKMKMGVGGAEAIVLESIRACAQICSWEEMVANEPKETDFKLQVDWSL